VHLSQPITIGQGKLVLHGVSAKEVTVSASGDTPLLNELRFEAKDCVIEALDVHGRVRLDSCTILGDVTCTAIEAVDCIFMGDVRNHSGDAPYDSFIGFSRVPDTSVLQTNMVVDNCTMAEPLFFAGGRAVLIPGTPDAVCFGASDAREMGAYHRGREGRPVVIEEDSEINALPDTGYVLRDVVFAGTLSVTADVESPLRLQRIAVNTFEGLNALEDGDGNSVPVLYAEDCLFSGITVPGGLVHLEYCTVLDSIEYLHIHASDCIFMDESMDMYEEGDCIRYSRIPGVLKDKEDFEDRRIFPECTVEKPLFFRGSFSDGTDGKPGCGVLHPQSPESVCFGAEDGGEMGAYHGWRYCLRNRAVLVKLKDYLPLGIEPVLIPDERLHVPPGSDDE
jgi:hypothetical protein